MLTCPPCVPPPLADGAAQLALPSWPLDGASARVTAGAAWRVMLWGVLYASMVVEGRAWIEAGCDGGTTPTRSTQSAKVHGSNPY
eukprot:530172-Prorocentrum_minimum.AAC.2